MCSNEIKSSLEKIVIKRCISHDEIKQVWDNYGFAILNLNILDKLVGATNDMGISLLSLLDEISGRGNGK